MNPSRPATRKEEIRILDNALENCTQAEAYLIPMLIATQEDQKNVRCYRLWKLLPLDGSPVYKYREVLSVLKLGIFRYVYGCNHKDSIFYKIVTHELAAMKFCQCCLYWRGVAVGLLLSLILFLSIKLFL